MNREAPLPRPVVLTLPQYRTSASSTADSRFRASSNEHSDGPSENVLRAVNAAARSANRYPEPYGRELVRSLAEHFSLDPSMFAVDNGSHALLNHVLLAYVGPASRVVFSWRSFEAYPISVAATGGVPVALANRPDGEHDLQAMLEAIDANTPVVILCNPNNPTGTAFGRAELIDFLEQAPASTLVVLDEAYIDFLDETVVPRYDSTELLAEYPNLLILRTFSKCYALAGFRVGYCIAHPTVISAIRSVQPTFPVSQLAVAAAIAALGEESRHDETVANVIAERRVVTDALRAAGLPVTDSHANFVWLPLGDASSEFARVCLEAGIIVRPFAGVGVRITVGQPHLGAAIVDAVGLTASLRA